MGYSKSRLIDEKQRRDPMHNWQMPRTTIFGGMDWYRGLNFPQQQCVAIVQDFLNCWQQNKYPYYHYRSEGIDEDVYDWLFNLICRQKSEILKWQGIDIDLKIKEKIEGHNEDSYAIEYDCEGVQCVLKFICK